jgi:hypothetical protein
VSTAPHDWVPTIARWVAGASWIYQGLVPKLLGPHADERAFLALAGVAPADMWRSAAMAGALEIALGIAMLALPRRREPHVLALLALSALLVFVAWRAPAFLGAAFNPVVGNACLGALSAIMLVRLRQERTANP